MDASHKDLKDVNGCKIKPVANIDSQKVEDHSYTEEDSESNSLLPPRKGGMSRKSDKMPRKVQWNDRNGNKLVEVLEFEPSGGMSAASIIMLQLLYSFGRAEVAYKVMGFLGGSKEPTTIEEELWAWSGIYLYRKE
ncbi:uncharacterized protein LOC120000345 isoform X1 [Tripterygium wilfordii]|uniref:uncharacterized protein LOC120000345 isoform X1 n=1 Tax=Tripterygium wilfordii TaxID=458696 RepID=UPI0018F80101|nr:uncharacterized protein LOC120000345 isoform X1 [Tripterygium wilfordii]